MWNKALTILLLTLNVGLLQRLLAFTPISESPRHRTDISAQNNIGQLCPLCRWSFLQKVSGVPTVTTLIGAATTSVPLAAFASDVRGPVELLRPGTQVRLFLNQAVKICQGIQNDNSKNSSYLEPLARFFDQEPASFLTPEEAQMSRRYLEINTSSAWQAARLKEHEEWGTEIGVNYATPYDKFNTAIQQWGNKTQFWILRPWQRRLEQSNSMRAAFNAYTNNLVFGDAYQLNVQGDEKRNMVRNNALPDVNAVVVSDLDLWDLYRNQVLENFDNAKAELTYQQKAGEVNVDEILNYLLAAKASCNDWFDFIPKQDAEQALDQVVVNAATT